MRSVALNPRDPVPWITQSRRTAGTAGALLLIVCLAATADTSVAPVHSQVYTEAIASFGSHFDSDIQSASQLASTDSLGAYAQAVVFEGSSICVVNARVSAIWADAATGWVAIHGDRWICASDLYCWFSTSWQYTFYLETDSILAIAHACSLDSHPLPNGPWRSGPMTVKLTVDDQEWYPGGTGVREVPLSGGSEHTVRLSRGMGVGGGTCYEWIHRCDFEWCIREDTNADSSTWGRIKALFR